MPANIYSVYVKLVGAGGGGGKSNGSSGCQWNGDGGGAGGLIYGYIDVTPLDTLDIIIGAGGDAGAGNYGNGSLGEETRIEVANGNILAQAYGGGGGMGGNSNASSPGSGGSGLFSVGSGIIKSGGGGSGSDGGSVSSIFYEYPDLGKGGNGSGCPNPFYATSGSAGYVFIEW